MNQLSSKTYRQNLSLLLLFCAILLVTIPCSTVAQIGDCDSALMHETDSLTGANIIRSQKNIIISDDGGKTGFAILGFLMDSTFVITIKTVGGGPCVNYGDEVHFVFNDSSNLKLANMSQFNCEAKSSLYFSHDHRNFDALQTLSQKTISRMTVWTRSKFVSKDLRVEDAEKIRDLLACFNQAHGDDTFVNLLNRSVFVKVDKQPEFKGGTHAIMQFLKKNIQYPRSIRESGEQGTVYVSFLVNKDGSITDVHIVKGAHPELNAEAERLVRSMPPWNPGTHKGKPVTVKFVIPIKFR